MTKPYAFSRVCASVASGAALALASVLMSPAWTADPESADPSVAAPRERSVASTQTTALRYDIDYPMIGYSGLARHNSIARLQERLNRGEVKLEFKGERGYLESLLEALKIDPSSQVLVYSKTSLQFQRIDARKPRAIYFNDDTYVAWVQDSDIIELAVMDSALGPVFYTLPNRKETTRFDREVLRCLGCHDKFALSGGGVPLFSVLSSPVTVNGEALSGKTVIEVTDRTPIEDRWAGWYVTGRHGEQKHLGNILVESPKQSGPIEGRGNLDTLQGLLDTRPYLTDKSDIVALLVLEHQVTIQNLITRINFKARSFVARDLNVDREPADVWDAITPKTRKILEHMMEPLVRSMLFADEARSASPISGTAGFEQWFEAQGPRDPAGRSLRQLDLRGRMFKYPLSYLIYSEAFDGLPDYVRSHVYRRLDDVLSGRDGSDAYSHLSEDDRRAVREILLATKPAFAQAVG
jgi:hypothetical protein